MVSSQQASVTREWDSLAGDWDDFAANHVLQLVPHFVERLPSATKLEGADANSRAVAEEPSDAPLRVIDFGCGTGVLVQHLLRHFERLAQPCEILAIDASSKMIEVLQDKILSREWEKVTPFCGKLADLDSDHTESFPPVVQNYLKNPADVILASHVFMYVPPDDFPATMNVLRKMLKTSGLLIHTDWMQSDEHPNGWKEDQLYQLHRSSPGWKTESVHTVTLPSRERVLLGVAQKQ